MKNKEAVKARLASLYLIHAQMKELLLRQMNEVEWFHNQGIDLKLTEIDTWVCDAEFHLPVFSVSLDMELEAQLKQHGARVRRVNDVLSYVYFPLGTKVEESGAQSGLPIEKLMSFGPLGIATSSIYLLTFPDGYVIQEVEYADFSDLIEL